MHFIPIRRILSISWILIIAGCGTLAVDINTAVESQDSINQEFEITASGLLAEMIQSEFDPAELRGEGWEAQLTREEEDVILRASIEVTGERARQLSSSENSPFEGFDIQVTDVGNALEYRISLDLDETQGEAPGTESSEDPFADVGEAMLRAMANTITIDWNLTTPGEIIETNADNFEGNQATWHLNLLDLQNAGELYAVSRVSKGGVCSGPIYMKPAKIGIGMSPSP